MREIGPIIKDRIENAKTLHDLVKYRRGKNRFRYPTCDIEKIKRMFRND